MAKKKRNPVPKKVTVTPSFTEKSIEAVKVFTPEIQKSKPDWRKLVKQLPDATSTPTQRWYGEYFHPLYTGLLIKLRALANE